MKIHIYFGLVAASPVRILLPAGSTREMATSAEHTFPSSIQLHQLSPSVSGMSDVAPAGGARIIRQSAGLHDSSSISKSLSSAHSSAIEQPVADSAGSLRRSVRLAEKAQKKTAVPINPPLQKVSGPKTLPLFKESLTKSDWITLKKLGFSNEEILDLNPSSTWEALKSISHKINDPNINHDVLGMWLKFRLL